MARIALLIALALAAACGNKSNDCSAVADKAISLIRADLGHEKSGEERQRRESMLPALKEELSSHCESEKWSPRVRECILVAKTTAELEKCDPDAAKPVAGDKKGQAKGEAPAKPDAPATK